MRLLFGLVCCLSLAAADVAQLRELQEQNRIFELRAAIEQPGWNASETIFYRAVAAVRFGREPAGIQLLQNFLATQPDPEMERKADEELASALARTGRYGEAARAWADALHLTPPDASGRADDENTRVLYEAMRGFPLQTIEFGNELPMQATRNAVGSWDVPVNVNGRQGEWIFDTGANQSVITESEAAQMKLSVRETTAYVSGSTEKHNALRLALARDLYFGPAHLRNVVFLVLADRALSIGPLKYQIHGILGLPVIRALGRVGISAKGLVRIETNAPPTDGDPNLFFDQLTPIVKTEHKGRSLQMFLDTGANESFLFPSFRAALAKDEAAKLQSKREKTGGAGGTVKRRVEVVPSLQLDVLGRPVNLHEVSLLSTGPSGKSARPNAVLGVDALAAGFTLDSGHAVSPRVAH